MPKIGVCSGCGRKRSLHYSHPETKKPICTVCYLKVTGKFGFCANCGKGERPIPYYDHETKKNICHNCHNKIKRREKGLPLRENRYPDSKAVIEALAARKREGKENFPRALQLEDYRLYRRACEIGIYLPRRQRKNPYPTAESVIEALAARAREGKRNNAGILILEDTSLYRKALEFGVALPKGKSVKPQLIVSTAKEEPKKCGRMLKYPTPESVIEALAIREKQGKQNYPKVLQAEDECLYRKALKFGVDLPRRNLGRGNRFPNRESVIEALKARIAEGKQNNATVLNAEDQTLYKAARKLGVTLQPAVIGYKAVDESEESPKKSWREPKYQSGETTIVALEARKVQGKANFPDVLMKEDILLCCAARRFHIELPAREGHSVVYREGDLVEDKIDPALAGKIGKVIGANEKGLVTSFGERERVRRIYEYSFNISNIVPYSLAPLVSSEPVQGEATPVEKEWKL